MIELQGVGFRYSGQSTPALHDVTLRVREGSLFGLLGPNGSGKTTLISILTGLLPAERGSVRVDGRDLGTQRREVQAFSSLVPQENAFYPTMTVSENLAFFAAVLDLPPGERRARIDEVLAIAGMDAAVDQRAGRLSGGMKRRVSIALGLLNKPRLLYLDEPTVGIDPQSRHFLLEAIKRINASGTTVVYSSHYMEEVEALCDEIGILDTGRVLLQGSLGELLAAARTPRLRIDASLPFTDSQRQTIGTMPGTVIHGTRVEFTSCEESQIERMVAMVREAGVSIAAVQYGAADLQEVFLGLTRTALRDH